MPHSSGGGSHGGGSHSSSHHSSGGGSHSSGSSIRTQNTYFTGSHRYVRYHDGRADYIFSSSSSLNKPASKIGRFLLICFYIPFFAVGIFTATQVVEIPKPLTTHYEKNVDVVDVTDRFTDAEEQELYAELTEFYNQTGIPVTIDTEANQYWQGSYNSLENYAYDLYVNHYSDEDHWLIVYSDDLSDRQTAEFNDWYFEGMQGYNTDGILTTSVTDKFNQNLNKQLLIKNNTTSQAFIIAFEELNKSVMKPHIVTEGILFTVFWNVFTIIHFSIMMFATGKNSKKYKDYIACPDDDEEVAKKKEIRCEYCNGVYYRGTVTSCPHCGAALPFSETLQ